MCPSFSVDHTKLKAGLYLRDVVKVGLFSKVKIWDLRFIAPSDKVYMKGGGIHAIEHILAQKLRYLLGKKYVDLSPFGCRTGFGLISTGSLTRQELLEALIHAIEHTVPICDKAEIPFLTEKACGNPRYVDKNDANIWLASYLNTLKDEHTCTCSNEGGM
jgi:S-ribosylhomocysteine lyase